MAINNDDRLEADGVHTAENKKCPLKMLYIVVKRVTVTSANNLGVFSLLEIGDRTC